MTNFLRILLLSLFFALPVSAPAWADSDFLAAREAYSKGQSDRFTRYASKISASHPLYAYIRHWELKRGDPDPKAYADFVAQFPDSPLAEHYRAELARMAGQNEDWINLLTWAARLSKPDVEISCYQLRAGLASGDTSVAGQGVALYKTARDLPTSCQPLFDNLFAKGALRQEDRLSRLRLALDFGNLRLARELDGKLSEDMRMDSDALSSAQRNPEQLIVAASVKAAQREAVFYALGQIAKSEPHRAAQLWRSRQDTYSEPDRQYGWGEIATEAARQLMPEAAEWFTLSGPQPSEVQAIWKARTMLRAGRWPDVYHTIMTLPADTQDDAVWRYWKARALKAMNATAAANALFARLSTEIHYYGLLAEEELPVRLEQRTTDFSISRDDLQAARAQPGLDRALRLRKMGLTTDATNEWEWALKGMSDRQLLAAAEVARQEEWYDRAINTADKTKSAHNFDLRYLTPYRDLAEAYSKEQGLDPAWVFGLMRQESRFVDYARSGVGAQGLMQIMPSTAKWIARQLGLGKNAHSQVRQPETNIRFGTYYLKNIMDKLDGSPVLATAGYNAGPGRARKWQANIPLEGAIYVESIPFTETREYVKKVLANAMFYSQRLGTPTSKLTDRLGVIPAKANLLAASQAEKSPNL